MRRIDDKPPRHRIEEGRAFQPAGNFAGRHQFNNRFFAVPPLNRGGGCCSLQGRAGSMTPKQAQGALPTGDENTLPAVRSPHHDRHCAGLNHCQSGHE